MRQQINLYQPILTQERTPLSARTVTIGMCVVIAGLAAISVYGQQRTAALAQSVEALRVQHDQQQSLLAQSGQLQNDPAALADAETRVRRLQSSVDERRRALQVLRSGAAGRTTGFAERLEALARRHIDGLWLDHLLLSGADGSLALSGATLDADLVPTYLQSLARERVLTGARFDDFVIERPDVKAATADEQPAPKALAEQPRHVRFRMGRGALGKRVEESPT